MYYSCMDTFPTRFRSVRSLRIYGWLLYTKRHGNRDIQTCICIYSSFPLLVSSQKSVCFVNNVLGSTHARHILLLRVPEYDVRTALCAHPRVVQTTVRGHELILSTGSIDVYIYRRQRELSIYVEDGAADRPPPWPRIRTLSRDIT